MLLALVNYGGEELYHSPKISPNTYYDRPKRENFFFLNGYLSQQV